MKEFGDACESEEGELDDEEMQGYDEYEGEDGGRPKVIPGTKLFVRALPQSTTAEDLKSYFSTFGSVIDSTVAWDRETKRSRRFGFVTFSNITSARAALALENHELEGKSVHVKEFDEGGLGTKRLAERDDGRQRYTRTSATYAMKLLVSDSFVAWLMFTHGRAESAKEDIQRRGESVVDFSPRGSFFPSTNLRVMALRTWAPESLLTASTIFLEKLQEFVDTAPTTSVHAGDKNGSYHLEVLFNMKLAGSFIGTGGEMARALRAREGAERLDIPKESIEGHRRGIFVGGIGFLSACLEAVHDSTLKVANDLSYKEWAAVTSFPGEGSRGDRAGNLTDRGGPRKKIRRVGREDERPRLPSRTRDTRDHTKDRDRREMVKGREPSEKDAASPEWLGGVLRNVSDKYRTAAYQIGCYLPARYCRDLETKKGFIKQVESTTGTELNFVPVDTEASGAEEMQQVTITGPLFAVYGAHAMMMQKYNETVDNQRPERSVAGGTGAVDTRIAEMQRQLVELQNELGKRLHTPRR